MSKENETKNSVENNATNIELKQLEKLGEVKSEEFDIDENDFISPWLRPIAIFFSPIKTFKSIKKSPSIWFVYFISILIPTVFMLIFKDEYTKEMIQSAISYNPLIAENRDVMVQAEKTIFKNGLIVALAGGIFIPLMSAGIIKLVSHFMKKEAKFKSILSMVLHLEIINLLKYLVNAVLVLVTGATSLNVSVTSLAFLLTDGPQSGIIYYLLVSFDLLIVWYFILKYYGLRIVAEFSKKATIIYLVVLGFLLFSMSFLQYFVTKLIGA